MWILNVFHQNLVAALKPKTSLWLVIAQYLFQDDEDCLDLPKYSLAKNLKQGLQGKNKYYFLF